LHIWGHASREHGPLWRTFLTEQRALVRELDELVSSVPSVQAPVLVLADPKDTLVPVGTARQLAQALPNARLQLVSGAGHHLPRRAPDVVAHAITAFMAAVESSCTAGLCTQPHVRGTESLRRWRVRLPRRPSARSLPGMGSRLEPFSLRRVVPESFC
jgi:hypothetical protein